MAGEVGAERRGARGPVWPPGLPVHANGPEFMTRELIKVGNRDLNGSDFTWVVGDWLVDSAHPRHLIGAGAPRAGNFDGYLVSVKENGTGWSPKARRPGPPCKQRLKRASGLARRAAVRLEKKDIGAINHGLERLRLKPASWSCRGKLDATAQADMDAERAELDSRYKAVEDRLGALHQDVQPRQPGCPKRSMAAKLRSTWTRWCTPTSQMPWTCYQAGHLLRQRCGNFVSDDPREANTKAGSSRRSSAP